MKKNATNERTLLIHDIVIVLLSIGAAFYIAQSDILTGILSDAVGLKVLGSFIAGIFFTSVFTTAPAIVALGEMSLNYGILFTALVGALGALIGDLIIFYVVRDRLSEHLMELLRHQGVGKRLRHLMRFKLFRVMSIIVGALVIASPLPDELGIGLIGFTKLNTRSFVIISLMLNFLGIVGIGLLARVALV